MIKSKKLSKIKHINHGFFNRKSGFSKGIYSSLNCGLGSKDKKLNIVKNLKLVCKKINVNYKKLFLLNQVHGKKIYFINKTNKFGEKKLNGDALITNTPGFAIAVLTADCAPVLIYDKKIKMISAIHTGWKGAYKGIIQNVVKFFIKKGSDPKDLIAVIGPCISQNSYEVGMDFKSKFIKKDQKNKVFFKKIKNKIYFSLNKYISLQLLKLGVKNLEIINKNTFIPKNNFFSARHSILKKDKDYGRNISIIMIN